MRKNGIEERKCSSDLEAHKGLLEEVTFNLKPEVPLFPVSSLLFLHPVSLTALEYIGLHAVL